MTLSVCSGRVWIDSLQSHDTKRSNTGHSRGKCDSKSSNRDTRAQKAVPKVSLCSHCRFLVEFRCFHAFFEIPVNFIIIGSLLSANKGQRWIFTVGDLKTPTAIKKRYNSTSRIKKIARTTEKQQVALAGTTCTKSSTQNTNRQRTRKKLPQDQQKQQKKHRKQQWEQTQKCKTEQIFWKLENGKPRKIMAQPRRVVGVEVECLPVEISFGYWHILSPLVDKNSYYHFGRSNTAKEGVDGRRPKKQQQAANHNKNTNNKKSSNKQQNQEQNSTNNNPETVRAKRCRKVVVFQWNVGRWYQLCTLGLHGLWAQRPPSKNTNN